MIRDPETLQILLDSIHQFVNKELIPRENEVADTDTMPADIVEQMKDMGLFGLTIPEEYGGLGVTMEEEVNIAFELGLTQTQAAKLHDSFLQQFGNVTQSEPPQEEAPDLKSLWGRQYDRNMAAARRALRRQPVRAGHHHAPHRAHRARHQAGILQRANAHADVHPFFQQIHHPIQQQHAAAQPGMLAQ